MATTGLYFLLNIHMQWETANGNLKEFWDIWRNTKRIIGGAIWEFKDQGLLKKDADGIPFYAYGGDYGEKYL